MSVRWRAIKFHFFGWFSLVAWICIGCALVGMYGPWAVAHHAFHGALVLLLTFTYLVNNMRRAAVAESMREPDGAS